MNYVLRSNQNSRTMAVGKKRLIIEIQTYYLLYVLFMNSYLNSGPLTKWNEDGPSNIEIQLDVTDLLLRNPRIFIGCWIVWSNGITEGDEGGGKYTQVYETWQYSWGGAAAQRAADGKSHCSQIQRLTQVDLQQLEWMNAAACVGTNARICRCLDTVGPSCSILTSCVNYICVWEGVGGGWGEGRGVSGQRASAWCIGEDVDIRTTVQ